jgi:prepilin-type N-terminal cleavage/methylation domain-containing protein
MPVSLRCSSPFPASGRSDDGFSLIEIVVAMFVLSVISMALLPLLITTARVSLESRTQVSATAQANAEIALLRQQFRDDMENSCAAIADAAAARTGESDPATGQFTRITVSGCPSTLPATMTVTVEVHSTAALDDRLSRVTTKFLVVTT